MPSVADTERSYMISALGLSETEAAAMTINDLRANFYAAGGSSNATLNLSSPVYVAHRGGGGIAPEETMEAFRTSVAVGADALEMDCQPLGDNALALMHDSTIDRTTDGTGPVVSFTAPAWRALNAAAKFPWNGRVLPPALLSEIIAEMGGNIPLFIEPKDLSNAAIIMDACDASGIKSSIVLEVSTLASLQAVKARGYKAYFWWGGGITSPITAAQAVAAGADYLGLDGTTRPDAEVTALISTGLPVISYTINRRADKARLLALGVAGFLTDHPAYLRATAAQRTVDSWRQGVLGHGFNVNATSPDMGQVTIASSAVTLAQQTILNAIPGEVCPIANADSSYTIDLDIGYGTLPASGGSVIVLFCLPDDKNRSLVNAAAFPNGYLVLLRATGVMNVYRLTEGTTSATQLGSAATTAALTAGDYAHLTISVTPTQFTVTRTDSAGTVGPVTDSTYRGGYIALGKKDTTDGTVRFKNLAIT